MSISTTIKTIQDIMRQDVGVDGDAQRISQLGWMLFLNISTTTDGANRSSPMLNGNRLESLPQQ